MTPVVGVVTHRRPDLCSPYFQEVLAGLRSVFGSGLLINPRRSVDGGVWVAPEGRLSPGQKRLWGDRPVVVLNGFVPGRPSIDVDNRLATRLATEHLFARGHRRVAVLKGKMDTANGQDRWRGVRDAFAARGIRPVAVAEARFDRRLARSVLAAWWAQGKNFSAVVAANDGMALGALDAARRAGQPLAVVGFDDSPEAQQAGLSSVAVPLRGLAARAGRVLKTWMKTGVVPQKNFEGRARLRIRGSSAGAFRER